MFCCPLLAKYQVIVVPATDPGTAVNIDSETINNNIMRAI